MSCTSDNLFLSISRCLSFNRRKPFPIPILETECAVVSSIFIATTPDGTSICSLALSGFSLLLINPLFKDMVTVLITCDFPISAPPVRNM